MKILRAILIVLFGLCVGIQLGTAEIPIIIDDPGETPVPEKMNYQGRLLNDETPVPDGKYEMTFRIFNAPADGGELWSEVRENVIGEADYRVDVKNGIFTVILGERTLLPNTVFYNNYHVYLETTVKIDQDTSISFPLQPITSVGYAFKAADSATLGNGAVMVDSYGEVGIGTNNPQTKLDVHGDVKITGDLEVTGSVFTNSSIRWKTNVTAIDDALNKILTLNGVYFNWKNDYYGTRKGKHDLGLIAEDVGKLFPELVVYEENGIDAKSMNYSKLVAVLIEAIKEQQSQIEELKSRVKTLENK